MNRFWHRFIGGLGRVLPGCIAQSQAIAFNMFLAFFPTVLLMLGVVATSTRLRGGLLTVVEHLGSVLPPGARRLLEGFLMRHATSSWKWISLGLGGTLLAGTHMMRLIIDGFRMVYGEEDKPSFWNRTLRALLLLVTTIAPWLLTANLIVFGKQMRGWMINRSGMPILIGTLWAALYVLVAWVLAMIVLVAIYRIGRPGEQSWRAVLPGAALATPLWWLVSAGYGLYMRLMPYGAVYGGLAATIGLMLWMQLTATVVLIGAAYNAERAGPA